MDRQVVRLAFANGAPTDWLSNLPGVSLDRQREDVMEMQVSDASAAQVILAEAVRRDLVVTQFDINFPSLNDVFLELVRGSSPVAAREPAVAMMQGA
jgi:ABC-type uncharacterized transport system ATPase subunit